MKKNQIIIVADYTESSLLTREELCAALGISIEFVNELIEFDIIQPQQVAYDDWRFDMQQFHRTQVAVRLLQDLEVNLAGAAIILDLLEQMEELRARAEFLEKHLLKR